MKMQIVKLRRYIGYCNPADARVLRLFILACAVCLIPAVGMAAYNSADITNTKAVLEKWVETRRIISQEKRDMMLAQEMLNERIALVQREIESLHGKIKEAQANIDQADKKRADMIEENEKLKTTSQFLTGVAVSLESSTKQLLERLPDAVSERVKPLSQRLPKDSAKTELSVSERFQNVVGILNEVDKFNREISVTSEVRTLSDNSSVEVAVIYFGIGRAYYTNAKGDIAGTGAAGDNDWVWKPENGIGLSITEAIAILKNEKAASFVQLPVEIK